MAFSLQIVCKSAKKYAMKNSVCIMYTTRGTQSKEAKQNKQKKINNNKRRIENLSRQLLKCCDFFVC